MKLFLSTCAVAGMLAAPAFAQQTSQQAVVGASGDPVYSLRIIGSNGVAYDCLPDLERDSLGRMVRVCRRAGATVANGSALDPATGLAALAGAAVIGLVASSGSGTD